MRRTLGAYAYPRSLTLYAAPAGFSRDLSTCYELPAPSAIGGAGGICRMCRVSKGLGCAGAAAGTALVRQSSRSLVTYDSTVSTGKLRILPTIQNTYICSLGVGGGGYCRSRFASAAGTRVASRYAGLAGMRFLLGGSACAQRAGAMSTATRKYDEKRSRHENHLQQ